MMWLLLVFVIGLIIGRVSTTLPFTGDWKKASTSVKNVAGRRNESSSVVSTISTDHNLTREEEDAGNSTLQQPKVKKLVLSPSKISPKCNFFYIRVPKTGSTSIHNMITSLEKSQKDVCSHSGHESIESMDKKYNITKFIVSLRNPFERFVSQYRYSYEDYGQHKNAHFNLGLKYPNINVFVSDFHNARKDLIKRKYWREMSHFVNMDFVQANSAKIKFICMSRPKIPVYKQLGDILGVRMTYEDEVHHNPSHGFVQGQSVNFTELTLESKQILSEVVLKNDLELYHFSGCDTMESTAL